MIRRLTVLAAAAAAAGASTAAPADGAAIKDLTLEPVTSIVPAAASPGSARVVLQPDDGHLVVQVPGRADRTVTLAGGCTVEGRVAGRDVLCTGPRTASTADGRVDVLPVQQVHDVQYVASYDGFGSRWVATTTWFSDRSSPLDTPVLVDRTTGRVVDLTGFYTRAPRLTARSYLDLDRPQPVRRLCAPVRRIGPLARITRTEQRGGWTLQTTASGHRRLQRCGATAHRTLHAGAILGDGAAAWTDGRAVTLLSLRTGRERHFAVPPRAPVTDVRLAFSADRLVVSVRDGDPPPATRFRVARVPLPR